MSCSFTEVDRHFKVHIPVREEKVGDEEKEGEMGGGVFVFSRLIIMRIYYFCNKAKSFGKQKLKQQCYLLISRSTDGTHS